MNIKSLHVLFPLSQGYSFHLYPGGKEKIIYKNLCYLVRNKNAEKIFLVHLSICDLWAQSSTKGSTNTQNTISPISLLSRASAVEKLSQELISYTWLPFWHSKTACKHRISLLEVPQWWMWYQSHSARATLILESLEQQHVCTVEKKSEDAHLGNFC